MKYINTFLLLSHVLISRNYAAIGMTSIKLKFILSITKLCDSVFKDDDEWYFPPAQFT